MISASLFVVIVAASVTALILLTMKLQKENSNFIDELQFFLRQRIIAHNKVKAQLAVAHSKLAKLELDYAELKVQKTTTTEELGFSGVLAETEFVEARNQKIEELEKEIHQLKNMQISDFIS